MNNKRSFKYDPNFILNSLPDGIFVVSKNREIVYSNHKAVELLGYPDGDLAGKKIDDLIPGLSDGVTDSFAVKKDGSKIPISAHSNFYNADQGERSLDQEVIVSIKDRSLNRQETDRNLTEKRNMAQIYLNIARVMIIVINKDQVVAEINKKGCEILGYSREDIIGKNWFDNFVDHRYRVDAKNAFKMLLKGQEYELLESYEYAITNNKGEKRFIHWRNAMITKDSTLAVVSSGEDITEQREMGTKLKKSQESLAEAQSIAHIGNWDWNVRTNELNWSEEIYGIYGLEPYEFGATYDAFLERVHPEDREKVASAVNRAVYSKEPYDIDHRIVLSDGRVRIVHEKGRVFFDPFKNQPTRMIGTIQDVTDARRAEKLLKEREEQFRAVFDHSGFGIAIISEKGVITNANKAFQEILGYEAEELKGKTVFDIIHQDYAKKTRSLYSELSKNEIDNYSMEKKLIKKSGKIIYGRVVTTAVRSLRGQPLFLIKMIQDITEHKHSVQALEEKSKQLMAETRKTSSFLNILEITSRSLNFFASLQQILPFINELAGSTFCLFYKLNKDRLSPEGQVGLSGRSQALYTSKQLKIEPEYLSNIQFMKLSDHNDNALVELLMLLDCKLVTLIPIKYENKVVAIVIFNYGQDKAFKGVDNKFMTRIINHLEAFYNTSMYSENLLHDLIELNQHIQAIKTMSNIDKVILRASTNEELAYGTITLLANVISGDIVEILRYDKDGKNFRLVAASKHNRLVFKNERQFSEEKLRSSENLLRGVPQYYPLLENIELGEYEQRFKNHKYRSLLAVPLLAKGQFIGIVVFGSKKRAAFSQNDMSLLHHLCSQMAIGFNNINLIEELQGQLTGIVRSLVTMLDAKSRWTKGHSARVSQIAVMMSHDLGLTSEQRYELELAGLFHDIGKIGTKDDVLDKATGLDSAEKKTVEEHPVKSHQILSQIPGLKKIARIAKHHHERWDGKGYPDQLERDEIPLLSRIVAIADAYEAMTSDRPYRAALTTEEASKNIAKAAGTQFDPDLVNVTIQALSKQAKILGKPNKKLSLRSRIKKHKAA